MRIFTSTNFESIGSRIAQRLGAEHVPLRRSNNNVESLLIETLDELSQYTISEGDVCLVGLGDPRTLSIFNEGVPGDTHYLKDLVDTKSVTERAYVRFYGKHVDRMALTTLMMYLIGSINLYHCLKALGLEVWLFNEEGKLFSKEPKTNGSIYLSYLFRGVYLDTGIYLGPESFGSAEDFLVRFETTTLTYQTSKLGTQEQWIDAMINHYLK